MKAKKKPLPKKGMKELKFEHYDVWYLKCYEHRTTLLAYAKALTKNDCDAEDLTGDVLMWAMEKQYFFDGGNLCAWLVQSLKNRFNNDIRKTKRRQTDCTDDFSRVNVTTINRADECFVDEDFEKAFKGLTEWERDVLRMQKDGFDTGEIAEMLHCKKDKVYASSRMGKAKLRKELPEYTKQRI